MTLTYHTLDVFTDRRFGGELVLRTGRVIPFDDAGCLVSYLGSDPGLADRQHSVWVTDFLLPHDLIRAGEAVFLVSDAIRTPMDYRVAALRPGPAADSLKAELGGTLLSWDAVRDLIRSRQLAGAAP